MKKGFTLAELIAVIVILSLICLITFPTVASILRDNKTRLCNTQLDNILVTAKGYAAENVFSMPLNDGDTKTITIQDLIDNGLIKADIQNPVTKQLFDTSIEITIKRNNKKLDVYFTEDTNALCAEDN